MRWIVIASVVLLSCASRSPAATGGDAGAAPQTQAPAGATSAPAGAAPTAAATAQSGPSFADVIRSGKAATYKVSYKWSTTISGKTESSEQTWFFKPPKARMDWTTTDQSGTKMTVSFIEVETGSYLCSSGSGQNFCVKTDPGAVAGQNPALSLQESFENDASALSGATQSRRTIAGQAGLCYTVGGLQAFNIASGTFCYTSTGVPLLLEWKSGDLGWAMEATSFSTSVSDGDFALPAPPQ